MLFGDVVTIYNRYQSNDSYDDIYFPTVIKNVCILTIDDISISKNNTNNKNAAILFINKPSLIKPYLPPKQWIQAQDKNSYFTLKEDDFFIKGNIVIDNPNFEDIKEKYDNVYKITTVKDYDLIPHFEVGGA